jgi:DNA-binding transcriptional ArsR family regulator
MEKPPDLSPIQTLQEAAECLKALGHPSRLRMVEILMQGDFAVHEIARLCQLPPHQACEHLRMLKGHGLLGSNRRGRSVYYQIVDPRLPRLVQCIRAACGQSTQPSGFVGPSTPDHPQDP